jgi:hypothetical protein
MTCPGHAGKRYDLGCKPCCLALLAAKRNDSNRDVFFRLLEAQIGEEWAEEVRKGWEDASGRSD